MNTLISGDPAQIPLRFFQTLQQQDWVMVWNLLSERSKRVIVELLAQTWKVHTRQQLREQFERGDRVAQVYWSAFAKDIRIETWLQQSYRALGHHPRELVVKSSPSGVSLLVVHEEGHWKFGYIESFMD